MKKLSLSAIALAAVMLTGCSDKESLENNTAASGEPVVATFKIVSTNTYTDVGEEEGSADENKISVVEFYMFDFTGARDETTAAYDYSYHKYEGSANREISFLVKSGIDKKILVAVNTNLGAQTGLDYDAVQQLIDARLMSQANSQQIESGKFAMSGKKTATIIENNTENEVNISIARLVSKIEPPVLDDNFEVKIPNEDLQEIFANETVTANDIQFEMTGYAVINGYNKSYVFTYYNANDVEYQLWDLWNPGGAYQKTTFDPTTKDILVAYSGTQNGSAWLDNVNVFVYESQPVEIVDAESGITGYEKDQVYAFLLRGNLTNTLDGTIQERYWRVNLIRDDNYKILRNCIYRVTLDSVNTVGYGTAEEGDEDEDGGTIVPRNDQTGIQAKIEVLPWRVKVQHTDF